MTAHPARKRFGQHFLHDRNVIERIVRTLDPKPDDRVVEIGPGLGALTRSLLPRLGRLEAVEFDRDLVEHLVNLPEGEDKLVVHSADALRFDFCALVSPPAKLRVIGNLPYNISTPLLFHLLDQLRCIQDMLFMLQKEVVDRLCAVPGNKNYGRLSVMVQWLCRVERIFNLGPGAFSPPPKVDSAVVRLVPHSEPLAVGGREQFAALVREAFSQRRKTLRNNLKHLLSAEEITAAGVDPQARAETLTLEQFARLSNTVADKT
jgi:16S rRNA (adenine1518-N6/adenine1519-N6)-dimethyltransferase